jgi:hypothetical protein
MAIYRITRTDSTDYDEFDRIVVRAASESEALDLVCRADPEEPYETQLFRGFRIDGSNAKAEEIPATGDAAVIVESFNAG